MGSTRARSLLHQGHLSEISFSLDRSRGGELCFPYIGNRGMDSFRSIDANAPVGRSAARPNPALGQVRQIQSEGCLKGDALELTFRGKPSKYFAGQIQYTLSRTYNNTSGITFFPANSYNPFSDWGRSDNDRLHKFDLLASSQATRFFTFGVAENGQDHGIFTLTVFRRDRAT